MIKEQLKLAKKKSWENCSTVLSNQGFYINNKRNSIH